MNDLAGDVPGGRRAKKGDGSGNVSGLGKSAHGYGALKLGAALKLWGLLVGFVVGIGTAVAMAAGLPLWQCLCWAW